MSRFFLFALSIVSMVAAAAADSPGLQIEFAAKMPATVRAVTQRWIQRAEAAVATYYAGVPLGHARLVITPRGGRAVADGMAFGYESPRITISLGREVTDTDLAADWVLTHEMLHLCFPSLPARHHWLEEGMATYVEPIARVRAGQISAERVWLELLENTPQGQPASGDRGLDFTPSWGRTYWGGAIFCLRADVEIRRRTGNRRGLEHALRAIRSSGGTIAAEWSIDRVLAVGDRATGGSVLRELYDESKATAVEAPLDALWRELGVSRRGRTVVFDDHAPLSPIRRAITQP